jgi:hypothetical protein
VLGQLGFIDDNACFDALEITSLTGFNQARIRYQKLSKYPFIVSSDSHFIKDIGSAITRMYLQEPSFAELKMAFRKQNGRFVMEQ